MVFCIDSINASRGDAVRVDDDAVAAVGDDEAAVAGDGGPAAVGGSDNTAMEEGDSVAEGVGGIRAHGGSSEVRRTRCRSGARTALRVAVAFLKTKPQI